MLTTLSLIVILVLVLALPFLSPKVEKNLEVFLFVMGALALTLGSQWSLHLLEEAAIEPIKITLAVLVAGLLFEFLRPAVRKVVGFTIASIGIKAFAFLLVLVLGLASSLITAIIAALLLVEPIIDAFISKVPPAGLYWINALSAILDKATMAAAEVGPSMTRSQLDYALVSLIVAGGMLIPGNIPNIVSAGKLGIKSREWLVVGVPIGACAMAVYFVALLAVGPR